MKYVIIGAGAAGITASKTIRELGSDNEIVVISTDGAVHSRCMLGDYISGERDEKGLSFIPDGFFENADIRWLSSVTVTDVDTENKRVKFFGDTEQYDKLLIATGANNVIPPVGGLREARNVFGLRHLSGAKAIRKNAMAAKNIIVIGAGLVGLNAAYALTAMGKKPIVVEALDSIMAQNLDKRAAQAYQDRFEEAGCVFRLGCKVAGTVLDEAGSVTSIKLDSGDSIPCDMAVVATGTRPAISFLANTAIECENGITVDEYLATNIDGVYAAGDATGIAGIWPNAMKQGEVAAKNMCGMPTMYDDEFALKNAVNFFGLQSLSIGALYPDEDDIVEVWEDRNSYRKVIMRSGIVVGVITQGNISNSGIWQHLVKNKVDISRVRKPVRKLSFADFYNIEPSGEYKWAT